MRFSISSPVTPFFINQHFAENDPCVIDFGKPTQKVIESLADNTCPVGSDKLYPHFGMDGHNGTDLRAGIQEVRAAYPGTVIELQSALARGLGVGILTDEPVGLDALGTEFVKLRYWHLKTILVQAGQHVDKGDLIGISDNTGYSNGNHLHFEGQIMGKDAGGHPFVKYKNAVINGQKIIAGAFNLEPFFDGHTADEVAKTITLARYAIIQAQKFIAWYIKNHPSV